MGRRAPHLATAPEPTLTAPTQCAHTRTPPHACTHKHMYHTRTNVCTWSHTYMHTRAEMLSFSCMDTRYAYGNMYVRTHEHASALTHTAYSQMDIRAFTQTCSCTQTTHACMHAHTCAHTLSQIRSVMAILFPSLQNRQHNQGEHFPFAKSYLQTLSTHVRPHPASPTVTENKLCLPHEMNLQEAGPTPLPMPTSGGEQAALCHPQPQNLH